MLLIAVVSVFVLNSCSSDDNDDPNVDFYGVWRTGGIYSRSWRYICIRPNGVVAYSDYNQPSDFNIAHWAYDKTTQIISMYRDDGYYAFAFKVIMSDDKKSWSGISTTDGKACSFVKVAEYTAWPEESNKIIELK